MIKRSVITIDPFVFRILSGEAGDTLNIAAQGETVQFQNINGQWTAPTNDKVFHPAETMIALPTCTQFFTAGAGELIIGADTITKSSGDGGYYYMNKDFMTVKVTDMGSVINFWHKDKKNLLNRTLHNLKNANFLFK